MKESLLSSTNDFDVVRLRDLNVFEDPIKMQLYRVVSSWKLYVQDRLRRETVIERFLLFKKRMTQLRCFLSWRSIAKYEQSSMNSTNFKNSQHFSKNGAGGGIVSSSIHSLAAGTREQSPRRHHASTDRHRVHSVRFQDDPHNFFNNDCKIQLLDAAGLERSMDSHSLGHHGASATFGQRSLASNQLQTLNESIRDTPRELRSGASHQQPFQGTSSLFGELEAIFQKNRKWLDEQREREEFLREMASHYNTRLS